MYICPLPSPTQSHSSGLSQSPGLSSLRQTANFRWLFILHIGRVYASNEVNEPRTYYTEWSKSESKKQILHINTYIWNPERWYWWTYLKGSNGDADIENRLEWTFLRLEFPEVNWWPWANSSTGTLWVLLHKMGPCTHEATWLLSSKPGSFGVFTFQGDNSWWRPVTGISWDCGADWGVWPPLN